MRNTLKVSKWEIKRNLKNKSFVIGLFITPLIIALFMIVPNLFSDSEPSPIDVFVADELDVLDDIKMIEEQNDSLNWNIHETELNEESILDQVDSEDHVAYIPLTEEAMKDGTIPIYASEDIDDDFMNQVMVLKDPLQQLQLKQLGFSKEELDIISHGVAFEQKNNEKSESEETQFDEEDSGNPLERLVPGAIAGIILFSIVISGMMIFQSASQEKKDKIAEIILSSLTPNELMQGKIIGYFVLGLVQVLVWLTLTLPVVIWKFDFPLFTYLFVPEFIVLLVIAILGYLLFASLFVGIGATIEDASTSGNFQGIVLMLPFLPFLFLGPILSAPSGMVAKITSFVPITSPASLLIRLSLLDEWPWMEIVISGVILILSVLLFMKLAGKIFKTGILLYGKNATPKEIWKWLWI